MKGLVYETSVLDPDEVSDVMLAFSVLAFIKCIQKVHRCFH